MFELDQSLIIDPDKWNSIDGEDIKKRHAERMKQIISEVSWPTNPMIGAIPSSEAWFLIQHANHDLEFQKEVLELLKRLPEGEFNKVNIAMLEDRVRKNQGLPQIYGTQWIVDKNTQTQVPYQIEDPEKVEERRKQVGLPTMEENSRQLKEWSKKATELKKKSGKRS